MRVPALELLYGKRDLADDVSQQARSKLQHVVASFADEVVAAGDIVEFIKDTDNAVLLLTGDHGGLTVSKARTVIEGMPGAAMTGLVTVDSIATLRNLRFVGSGDPLVSLTANAAVRFVNCWFQKAAGSTGDVVSIANGGKALFHGCWFGPANTAGTLCVDNAGAALDVNIYGDDNDTGLAHNNVTVFGAI